MNKVKYFCKLCEDYNVELRLNHLIKVHNAINGSRDGRFKPLYNIIFLEVKTRGRK